MKRVLSIVSALAVAVSLAACDAATVERVVDGDTIDVDLDGETVRVRLLNVDTPETVDPDRPVECMGPEATQFLEDLLPPGTEVGLEYDDEKTDGYGRTLAGVYLEDRTLVNAEIARQGLGYPVVVGDNDRFYAEVSGAAAEAVAAARGLYDPDVDCTLVAKVADLEEQARAASSGPAPSGSEELAERAAVLAAIVAQAEDLRDEIDGRGVEFGPYGHRVDAVRDSVERQAEAERKAEAERQAEAQAERKAEAERKADAEPERETSSGSESSGLTDPGYTGCRAYGSGGRWLDKNGNRYDKIDCTTKAVIG